MAMIIPRGLILEASFLYRAAAGDDYRQNPVLLPLSPLS
jgi:hypothetical protein